MVVIREFYGFGYGDRPSQANLSGRCSFTEGRLKSTYLGDTLHGLEDFKMDAFVG